MKKIIIIAIFIISTVNFGYSQKMGKGKGRIQALKATYITNTLDLTASEAEKFWPIYNKYNAKIQELRIKIESESYREIKKSGSFDTISEEQAETILNHRFKLEEAILSNKIALTKDLKKIISSKKILKLQKAERDFNRELLQEYGKRRGMKRS